MTAFRFGTVYRGATVLVTGHTGFKGAWLTLWLHQLGAKVVGFALAPSGRTLFVDAQVAQLCTNIEGDIRDLEKLRAVIREHRPTHVFHLAAQALVRTSYEAPLETFDVNARGTATILEALRLENAECSCVVISSDKCYENREWPYAYRETDALGGHDVYSMSKGATELVVAGWRQSFFSSGERVRLASARAGNVIGGGDWAEHRLVPDSVRALAAAQSISVRNPSSVRPWQHVLEALSGYLTLDASLNQPNWQKCTQAFNFGPSLESAKPVRDVVDALVRSWGAGRWLDESDPAAVHEAGTLRLSIDKASSLLGWAPTWGFERTIDETVKTYRQCVASAAPEAIRASVRSQIEAFAG